MKKIKFGDIKINELSKQHVMDCLAKDHVTMGEKTKLLEDKWSKLFGHDYTAAVSSGTSACIAMCLSLYDRGAKPGDEIIVPALSFIATANSIRAAGFFPRFIDVKSETLNINPALIEKEINDKTRAIMFVNLMGKPAELDEVVPLAKKYGLAVLGDCCESHGCKYHGRYMESFCDATSYSCYAAHVLFSCELGFVCTNNSKIDECVRSVRSHGRHPNSLYFDHIRYGLNLKPTDLHASVGLGNVEHFWEIFNRRRDNVEHLKSRLSKLRNDFWFSEEDVDCVNSPHAFSLTSKGRIDIGGLQKFLDEKGIEWKRNFGSMPGHGCFSHMGQSGDFPCATYIGNNGLHFGVHHLLTDEDVEYIADSLNDFYAQS